MGERSYRAVVEWNAELAKQVGKYDVYKAHTGRFGVCRQDRGGLSFGLSVDAGLFDLGRV